MVIREGDKFVEIRAAERVAGHLPTPGDARLTVSVRSGDFRGQGSCWVEAPRLAAFVAQLRALEAARQGVAEIEAMSPGEFKLRIWSVNRRGSVAVAGCLGRRLHTGEAGPYPHAVEFGFEFSPSLLPQVVAGFQAIAEGGA